MYSAGLDIGSRTIKLAIVADGKLIASRKVESSYDPLGAARRLLNGLHYDALVATGYGRHTFAAHHPCQVISEIKAFAQGAHVACPGAEAVLDIGGQDTKTIALAPNGSVLKFEMNDRCAAGTGRFLEIMANALHYSMEEFAQAAASAKQARAISSMCTVFAESEVISAIAGGAPRDEVALGIHEAILQRVLTMVGRLPRFGGLVFAGGVAYNACLRQLLAARLGVPLVVPPDPQIIGALGAALEGSRLKAAERVAETVSL